MKSGETLAEVETDKAVMELVARADGQLLQQVVAPKGATVPVGDVVAVHRGAGEDRRRAGGALRAATPRRRAQPRRAVGACTCTVAPPLRSHPQSPQPRSPSGRCDARQGLAPRAADRRASGRRPQAGPRIGTRWPSGEARRRAVRRGASTAAARHRATARPVPAPRCPAREPAPPSRTYRSPRSARRSRSGWRRRSARCPHFFLTTDVDMERAAEARDALNRQLGEQGKGQLQRHHPQGRRAGARAAPRLQRLVAGRPHPLLERGAPRHGGRGRGRADHAGASGTPTGKLALRDRCARRASSPQRARERRLTAGRVHRRDVLGLEPRHVRHRPVHGRDQSPRGGDRGRGRDRAQGRRGGRRGRPCGAGCGSP